MINIESMVFLVTFLNTVFGFSEKISHPWNLASSATEVYFPCQLHWNRDISVKYNHFITRGKKRETKSIWGLKCLSSSHPSSIRCLPCCSWLVFSFALPCTVFLIAAICLILCLIGMLLCHNTVQYICENEKYTNKWNFGTTVCICMHTHTSILYCTYYSHDIML